MTPTTRMPTLTVGTWCARWHTLPSDRNSPRGRQDLLDAGLAEADVLAFEAVVRPREDLRDPAQAFVGMLLYLGGRNASLTLPAAIGWSLVGCLVHTKVFVIDRALDTWDEAGLIEHGWLFEMARMRPVEAAALLVSGDETALDGVRVLAGLCLNSPSPTSASPA